MSENKTDHHELWLFELAQGNLTDSEILQGFVKYYAMKGYALPRVQEDLIYRSRYGHAEQAMDQLMAVLEKAAEGKC